MTERINYYRMYYFCLVRYRKLHKTSIPSSLNNEFYYRFFDILVQKGVPIIPISQVFSTPTETALTFPNFAALTSILSIGTSIFALVIKCKMNIFGLLQSLSLHDQHTKGTVLGSVASGSLAPLMCLFSRGSLIEFIFWCIPLLILGLYYTALHMMKQVQDSLEELEKSKYKYKGA